MSTNIYDQFKNPSAAYRGKPFWAWNGKLDKKELFRQIHEMKEMGFGGFFMHSRTGLVTEYLGEEWFELINLCADEAEKLGMEAWLYDEDRWPSGTAGGLVTETPEFRQKFLRLRVEGKRDFHYEGGCIAAFVCRLEGINFFECRQIAPGMSLEEMEGDHVLSFYTEESECSSFYNGYTFVDTLNRKATERFLELTHEKYARFCGGRLGTSIKGIFIDEPHRGPLMNGFAVSNPDPEYLVPWTYDLFHQFEQRFGYDLVPLLPELFLRKDGEKVSRVKWHFIELLMEMFLENFIKPINAWCNKHNMKLTGHIVRECTITGQTANTGSVMRCYEFMDYPGIDVLREDYDRYWSARQVASVARQMGKEFVLSEMYGVTGWHLPFEGHKNIGDWQTLFGVNLRCHHLSWYTMEGEAKRDYPASILSQSAWWREYKYVEDYFSRLGLVMSQGEPCCDILVINPVESLWCQVYAKWSSAFEIYSEEAKELESKYINFFHWLTGNRIALDYGDEDMIARLYDITCNDMGETILKVGRAEYRLLVVAGLETIRSSTLEIINSFLKKGGKVLFAGTPPQYVDAVRNNAAFETVEKAIYTDFSADAAVDAINAILPPSINIRDKETKKANECIFCSMRQDDSHRYIMLLNIDKEKPQNVEIEFNLTGETYIEEWNCAEGERYYIGHSESPEGFTIHAEIAGGGEKLYVLSKQRPQNIPVSQNLIKEAGYCTGEMFEYKLDEPNICVLDIARFRTQGGRWSDETEILKIDREIRKMLDLRIRDSKMIQPWYRNKYMADNITSKTAVQLKYTFYIDEMPENQVYLVMENPGKFSAEVNGIPLELKAGELFWVDNCFKCFPVLMEILSMAENTIVISTEFDENTGLEAMYLIGDFGVKLDGYREHITALPKKLKAGDITLQGLPFYSGGIAYGLKADEGFEAAERIQLQLEKIGGACAKVTAAGHKSKLAAWKPYNIDITEHVNDRSDIWLEIILTRKNTFGPLHLLPAGESNVGPASFTTEGDKFSLNYVLEPAGLLGKIEICKLRK